MKSRDGKYTVDKTKNGTWRVRFYCEQNVRRGTKVKTITERDALVRSIKRREDLDFWFPVAEPEKAQFSNGIFDALADDWLVHGECVREISKSCLINYRSHLHNHIRPVIGMIPLRDLQLKHVEALAIELKSKRPQTRSYTSVRKNRMNDEFFEDDEFLSMAYRREILTVACMITKYGFERGLMAANPFAEYKLPETPEQPYDYWRLDEEDRFLTWLESGGHFQKPVAKRGTASQDEPEYFLRKFKMRPGKAAELYDIVLFALRSGLRKGEIGALRACDVNFANNLIIVRRSWSEKERCMKKTTKGNTFRRVEMNQDMIRILKRRIQKVKSEKETLFNSSAWAIRKFSKYCALAGVREIHFHSLRHTCLTNLANGYGMDKPLPLPQVQLIAGHREISTTMRYVHTDGIENTTSRQWSREQRKAMQEQPPKEQEGKVVSFRLIAGGAGM